MKNIIKFIPVLITVLFLSHTSLAADELFIPLGTAGKPARIITVSHSGGDFTDPVAAVASITDASAENRYLVLIGPGIYIMTKTLAMQPFVSIAGAGQETTVLTGAISSDTDEATSAIISGADNSVLRDLSIENTGGLGISIALYNNESSPFVSNVTATATGGEIVDYGIKNTSSSSRIADVTAIGDGGFFSSGLYNDSSSPIMSNVRAFASGGEINYGVFNYSSSLIMNDVTANAYGHGKNYGVFNNFSSFLSMTGVTATASGGEANYGMYNGSSSPVMSGVTATATGGISYGMSNVSSSLIVSHSMVKGEFAGIHIYGGTLRFRQSSILQGTVIAGEGNLTCVNSDDGVDRELGSDCQPLP